MSLLVINPHLNADKVKRESSGFAIFSSGKAVLAEEIAARRLKGTIDF